MNSRLDPRWTVCLIASLTLHGAFLAWVDYSGGGPAPSSLTLRVQLAPAAAQPPEAESAPVALLSSYRSRDLFARPVSPRPKPLPPARAASGSPAPKIRAEVENQTVRTNTSMSRRKAAKPENHRPPRDEEKIATELAASAPPPSFEKERARDGGATGGSAASSATAGAPEPVDADRADTASAAAPEKSGALLALLHQAIEQRKHYPGLARRQGRQGTATVRFRLSPSGAMDAVTLDRSSGFSALDTAALSAVSGVAPFAPARSFLSEATRFKVNVTFRLN